MILRQDACEQLWIKEYQRKGIPSSFRKDPTRGVIEFLSWLERKNQKIAGLAADIGCGQGRNSYFLASQGYQVVGIELLEANVNLINEFAGENHVPIKAIAQDASNIWPFDSDSLDIAIDVFCYKHIVDKERQAKYRHELWRTLKPHGFYFISLAAESDGFYGPLLQNSVNFTEKLVVDPHSGIPSFLYSIESLSREFSDLFEVIEITEQTSVSPMHGKEYSRQVLNGIFRKRLNAFR